MAQIASGTDKGSHRSEPAVIIRPAADEDANSIAEIFAYYVRHSMATFEESVPTVDRWRRRISDLTGAGYPFIVADVGGEVAGYAYATSWREKPAYRFAIEDTVYVAPDLARKGIGGKLLRGLLVRCADAGFRRAVAVIARTEDPASTALHASAGFREVGVLTRVGFKHGRWIDTVLMELDLDDLPFDTDARAG